VEAGSAALRVDWPVYPRLRRTMQGSERERNSGWTRARASRVQAAFFQYPCHPSGRGAEAFEAIRATPPNAG
jgi:hypothetical protein